MLISTLMILALKIFSHLKGTGDIATDMENQVTANTLRIQILEEQNSKLRRTILKLLGMKDDNVGDISTCDQQVSIYRCLTRF